MLIGLIPNITKPEVKSAVNEFIKKLTQSGLDFTVSNQFEEYVNSGQSKSLELLDDDEICKKSDILISFGGDGTMLNTAYLARDTGTPILGVNFGKLGFLAEFKISQMDLLINDLKTNNIKIEERITLDAVCNSEKGLYAVNDFVLDRGKWPKMIEMTLKVDDDYVSTFSADGIIVSTPTGSTGYSLSVGGPIISPKANAITISPISPHILTMRPLVLSSDQKISIEVYSHFSSVQINCDGQRVSNIEAPLVMEITKSNKPLKLVHSKSNNYFNILRTKLFWGLDIRNSK